MNKPDLPDFTDWNAAVRNPSRLSTLRRLNLLDSPAEDSFDRISRLAAKVLGVPIALVSLVDLNRQYFKSCIGLPEPYDDWRETPLESSFCKHVVANGEPLVLNDARAHLAHQSNGAIRDLGAVAYLGAPLRVDDEVVGTFCVIDTRAHNWTDDEISIVHSLAAMVMTEIDLRGKSAERAAALEARDQVLAIVSHDLRAPVQTVLTSIGLLELDVEDPVQRSTLDAVRRAATQMNRLIGDLLDVSTLEFDTFSVELERLSVNSLLGHMQQSIAARAEANGLSLKLDVPELPDVLADRERLTQVLTNLLDNALRLTPAGGSIRIGARHDDGEVLVSIGDTGPGIAADELEHIFDWCWHAGREDKGGSGLGLGIAKAIVTAHGGRIWADNRAPGGAVLTFALPEMAA